MEKLYMAGVRLVWMRLAATRWGEAAAMMTGGSGGLEGAI